MFAHAIIYDIKCISYYYIVYFVFMNILILWFFVRLEPNS